MKLFIKVFVCSLICFFSNQLVAASPIQCPSIDTIKANATFIRANRFHGEAWLLRSNHFKEDDHTWDILFGVFLPGTTSAAEALQQGQKYFQQSVILNPPILERSNQVTGCFYLENDDYLVYASSPPGHFPNFS